MSDEKISLLDDFLQLSKRIDSFQDDVETLINGSKAQKTHNEEQCKISLAKLSNEYNSFSNAYRQYEQTLNDKGVNLAVDSLRGNNVVYNRVYLPK